MSHPILYTEENFNAENRNIIFLNMNEYRVLNIERLTKLLWKEIIYKKTALTFVL